MKLSKDNTSSFRETINQTQLSAILGVSLACVLLVACSGPLSERPQPANGSRDTQAVEDRPGRSQVPIVSGNTREVILEDVAVPESARQNSSVNTGASNRVRKEAEEAALASGQIRTSAASSSALSVSIQPRAEHDATSAYYGQQTNRENYLSVDENGVKRVSTDPVSTF